MTDKNHFPLLGYVNQNTANAELANEAKILEERVIRFFDKIGAVAVQREEHGREAALGRMDMAAPGCARRDAKQAFMWAVRAIFNPGRVRLPEDVVTNAVHKALAEHKVAVARDVQTGDVVIMEADRPD